MSTKKEVSIEDFFNHYPSVLNNQQKTKIKKSFIRLVKVFEEHDLIESKYKIISEGFLVNEKLTI